MKISLNWLREFPAIKDTLPKEINPKELEDILTMLGFEVDEITDYAKQYDKFVTAYVEHKEPHPNADKLSLCTVVYGEQRQVVVCGAPNVAAGQKIILGLSGAIVPNGGFELSARKIRGVESNGMICSKSELGIEEDHSGIWVLPAETNTNIKLADFLDLNDIIFELSLTPNKADCLSHWGVARELAAYYGTKANLSAVKVDETGGDINKSAKIFIQDSEACPRYLARVVRGVEINESPAWLKSKLTKIGLRSINNIVDITNLVLMEIGQPLHAFDLDTLAKSEIVVRTANEGEKFTTLDSKERLLDSQMLMICDGEKPAAIAGVMGGLHSEITNSTKNVLIESAFFKPTSVRRTGKKLALRSDAAYRFERGVDISLLEYAADRAASLIQEVAGGVIEKGIIDVYPNKIEKIKIELRFAEIVRLLGLEIPKEQVISILENLHFEIIAQTANSIEVAVPYHRHDCTFSVDLIEDIARYYHYDKIPVNSTIQLNANSEKNAIYSESNLNRNVLDFYVSRGFNQIYTQFQISKSAAAYFDENPIVIENPLGEELSIMRPSMLPSMLRTIAHNIRYGNSDLQLIEIGKTFHRTEKETFIKGIEEREVVALAITGKTLGNWQHKASSYDFYNLKGQVMDLISELRIEKIDFAIDEVAKGFAADYANIVSKKVVIGSIGAIEKKLLKEYEIEQEVFIAVIDLKQLALIKTKEKKYSKLSQFPEVERDLAFLVNDETNAIEIQKLIAQTGQKLLSNVDVFDVYKGKNIELGKKSLAFNMKFTAEDRTLTTEEIDSEVTKIIQAIETKFSAQLRK